MVHTNCGDATSKLVAPLSNGKSCCPFFAATICWHLNITPVGVSELEIGPVVHALLFILDNPFVVPPLPAALVIRPLHWTG